MNERFEWISHPVKESVKKNIIAAAGIIVILAGGFIWLYIPGVLLGLLIIMLTLLPYFLPTKYIIDEKGVEVHYMFQKKMHKWQMFRSYYNDENGILLSPFRRPSRLENYRGLYVRFGSHKQKITELIKYYMESKKEEVAISGQED